MYEIRTGAEARLFGIAADEEILLDPVYGYTHEEFMYLKIAEECDVPITIVGEVADGYWDIRIGAIQIDAICCKYLHIIEG